ncbi:MAG: P-loop NTPase [Candidatus Bathyarchaeia archaeon]
MKKIAVVSGKGGTGKSTIAYSLALSLVGRGFKVALVDLDLTGPNVRDILGGEIDVDWDRDLLIPADKDGLRFISLAHVASEREPILWKGKDCASVARQLIERVDWEEPDYMVFDFPPGSPDESKSALPLMDYVLIVSIPSALARSNAERIIEMCREFQTPILGVIMNMTRFVCECGREYRIFPEDHSFEDMGVPTIAEIPIDPEIARSKLINRFPVDAVLEAMKKPVLLPRKVGGLRSKLLKLLLRRL